MLNINVTGETKYLANMHIYTVCHRKYQNKSSLTRTSALPGEVSFLPPVLPTLPRISACKTASVTGKKKQNKKKKKTKQN